MAYPISTKENAIQLRKQGFSIKEIAKELKIAKSTSSLWLDSILIDDNAQSKLKEKRILGQYKARTIRLEKTQKQQVERLLKTNELLSKIEISQELSKLCCSLLYWCEGNKGKDTQLRFTNSDPKLVKTFLYLLRTGFNIEESKFRILMHLHNYHEEEKQKKFWGEVTKVPVSQFYRTYWKPNTGKNKHENYPGCIAISYYDAEVAKDLTAIYNTFVNRGVG